MNGCKATSTKYIKTTLLITVSLVILIIIKYTIDVHLIMCTYDFRMLPEFNQSQQLP